MENDLTSRFQAAYWILIHNADAFRLRVWEEHGVSLPQLRILFSLRRDPDATTTTLAKQLGVAVPTVSAQVDKLVRAGLIARGGRATDRRVIPLSLTDTGRDVVGAISQVHKAYLDVLARDLGPDLVPISRALERLAAAVAERPAQTMMDSRMDTNEERGEALTNAHDAQ
jgi:DNA-binding MarR family transcriptional regulator